MQLSPASAFLLNSLLNAGFIGHYLSPGLLFGSAFFGNVFTQTLWLVWWLIKPSFTRDFLLNSLGMPTILCLVESFLRQQVKLKKNGGLRKVQSGLFLGSFADEFSRCIPLHLGTYIEEVHGKNPWELLAIYDYISWFFRGVHKFLVIVRILQDKTTDMVEKISRLEGVYGYDGEEKEKNDEGYGEYDEE